MKIALVADSVPVLHGESVLINLLSGPEDSRLDIVPVCPAQEPLGLALKAHGLPVIDLPFKKADSPFQVADLLARFWSIVAAESMDIIYALSPRAARYGMVVSQFTHIPLVYHSFTRRSRGMQLLMKRFADGIVCSSRYAVAGFVRATAPVEIIYNGVEQSQIPPVESKPDLKRKWGLEPDVPVVGMVTDLTSEDRVDIVIRVFRQVLDEVPRSVLLITGFGLSSEAYSRQQHLSRVIRSLDLHERVVIRRFFPHFKELYAVIDMLVSLSGREDGLFPLIEAGANGVPVIAAKTEWAAECVDDGRTGILVRKDNEQDLRQALRRLLMNKAKTAKMSAAALSFSVDRFSAGTMRCKLAGFLKNLAALTGEVG